METQEPLSIAGAPLALFETPVIVGVWPNRVGPNVRKSNPHKQAGFIAPLQAGCITRGKEESFGEFHCLTLYWSSNSCGSHTEERRVGKERRSRWSPYH